jgi:hypothetical protein
METLQWWNIFKNDDGAYDHDDDDDVRGGDDDDDGVRDDEVHGSRWWRSLE